MKALKLVLFCILISVNSTANAKGYGSIWRAVMDYYGNTLDNGYHCTWDTNPSTEGIGGWVFTLGADRMPAETCFSLMRLMVMKGPDLGLPSMNFFGEGRLTYFQAQNGTRGPAIQECGTRSLKKPYDLISPELIEKILELIKSKGAPAGMRELEKILNQNVELTCMYS